jgi:ankyrin repeat protein
MLLQSISNFTTASNLEDIIKLVQILIGSGVDVNAPDSLGIIPINVAIPSYSGLEKEEITAVRLLLEAGANVDAKTVDKTVALNTLDCMFNDSQENVLKLIDLLIDYGADTSGVLYKTVLKMKANI